VSRLAKSTTPRRPGKPRALILAPTRELVAQIDAALAPLAKAMDLRSVTIFGGVGFGPQISALRSGVDIVVACPGRLEDLIKQGVCNLGDVEVTVLDEADHMSDLGFLPAVRRLLRRTPANSQRLLFSATLDGEVDRIVREFLHDPVTHSVDRASEPVPDMTHHVFTVRKDDRTAVVQELAERQQRRPAGDADQHLDRRTGDDLLGRLRGLVPAVVPGRHAEPVAGLGSQLLQGVEHLDVCHLGAEQRRRRGPALLPDDQVVAGHPDSQQLALEGLARHGGGELDLAVADADGARGRRP